MKFFVHMLLIFILSSCGSSSTTKPRPIGQFYRSSDYKRYLLPQRPQWSQFSQNAECALPWDPHRVVPTELERHLNLNYLQVLQFQILYNKAYQQAERESEEGLVDLRADEILFQDALKRAQGGISGLKIPQYKRIHLIWVDPLMKKETPALAKLKRGALVEQGYPVFISLCHSGLSLEEWIHQQGLDRGSFQVMGADALLVKPVSDSRQGFLKLEVDAGKIFQAQQKIYFYSPLKNHWPNEWVGPLIRRSF